VSTLPKSQDRGFLAALMLSAPYLLLLLVPVAGLALVLGAYVTVQDTVRVVTDHLGAIVTTFAVVVAFVIAHLGGH
jgi:hypothetical protein